MPVRLSRQPTEEKENHCQSPEEENILSDTGINAPAFSPFIMKGYAGHACKPYLIPERKIDDEVF